MPDSLWPNGLWPTRFLCPWDFLGKDTGVVFHFLLQGIFPTQGSNLGLLYCRQILHRLSYQGLILACYSFNLKNFLIESLKYVHRQSYVTPWQQWLLWLTTKSSRIKHIHVSLIRVTCMHLAECQNVGLTRCWVNSLSHVRLFATPWTIAYQAPWSMGFSRQEYWSGLSFPSPGDLPNPGSKAGSPALQTDALPSEPLCYTHIN